jgi:hypothetical protein
MTPTLDIANRFQELDYRESNGIQVSLLWNRSDNSVSVAVFDVRSDETFEIAVAADFALDAFHHPFAYAPRSNEPAALAEESQPLSR